MDAYLQIQVKIVAREALAQLAALSRATTGVGTAGSGSVAGMSKAGAAVEAFNGKLKSGLKTMEAYGKNMQWTGRQLSFTFTLPLLLAGAAATKFALDNEKAMTDVKKVYGDGTESSKQLRTELDLLSESFRLLSDRYGVQQSQVIGIARDWAQAGSAGVGLAKATKLTLEAMVVGSMTAEKATTGLISVQSIYRLSTDDTRKALELMNSVENATATDMQDLITSFTLAGGTARVAGVDVRHLAAMTAALVPAAGSASQAGNSLKTIISRIMAPTKQAAQSMEDIGINVNTVAWQSKSATERLEVLSKKFDGLATSQKSVIAANIAGRRQASRYVQLMTEMADKTGFYARALQVTSSQEKAHNTYQKELLAYLNSSPQKVKILTTMLQNFLASAIIPLLPALVGFLVNLTSIAKAFSDLSPNTQQFIMFLLAGLAILGPFIRILGGVTLLFSQLGHVILWGGKMVGFFLKAIGLIGPTAMTAAEKEAAAAAQSVADREAAESAKAAAAEAQSAASVASSMNTATVEAENAKRTTQHWVEARRIMSEAAAAGGAETVAATEASTAAEIAVIESGLAAEVSSEEAANAAKIASDAAAAGTAVEIWTGATVAIGAGLAAEVSAEEAANAAKVASDAAAAGMAVEIWTGANGAIGAGAAASAAESSLAWEIANGLNVADAATTAGAMGVINTTIAGESAAAATATAGFWSTAWTTITGAAAAGWAAMTAPAWVIVAVIAAVVLAAMLIFNKGFRDKIIDGIKAIGRGIAQLPRIFGEALAALARVVAQAVKGIMDMLSYLNPFAHHSPSMVENVTAGIGIILDQYKRLGAIGPMMRDAASAHNAFLNATAPARANALSAKRADQRQTIATVAPQALPAFDKEVATIGTLTAALGPLQDKISEQQNVVDAWQKALDGLDVTLRNEKYTLETLGSQVDTLTKQMQSHKDALDDLMATPIEGMNAMEDAIFANQMAMKKLQLQMMDMAGAGQSIDSIADKMSRLNGEIEKVSGEQKDLRLAGAGSDVLGPLNDQLDSLNAQKDALSQQSAELSDLQDQLDALKAAGDRLDLEKSITFDPQIRQLDILVNRMKEMPFDDILKSVLREKTAIASIQPHLDAATSQYKVQQAIVDALQARHDAVSHALDLQNDKLKTLQDSYSAIKDLVDKMESSLLDSVSAAQDLADAADRAKPGDAADAVGNFDIPEATGSLGREGDAFDIKKFNDDMQKQLDDMMKGMGKGDPFKTIKDKWHTFQDDFKRGLHRIGGWFSTAWDGITRGASAAWDGITRGASAAWGGITRGASAAWDGITRGASVAASALGTVFSFLLDGIIKPIFNGIAGVFNWLWTVIIQPVFNAISGFFMGYVFPVFQLFGAIVNIVVTLVARVLQFLWNHVDIIFTAIGAAITVVGMIFNWLYQNVVLPVWNGIKSVLSWGWDHVIKPIWDGFKTALGAVGDALTWLKDKILVPVWDGIKSALKAGWDKGIKPIWDGFKDGIHAAGDALNWLHDKVVTPVMNGIKSVFKSVVNSLAGGIEGFINGFISAFNVLAGAVSAVGRFLHISVSIDAMDKIHIPRMMAKGGQIPSSSVGAGFVTDGARAIVGEGRPQHPEYVVPTDPAFRRNALDLWRALGADLGAPGLASGGVIPAYGIGGVIGSIGGAIGGAVKAGVGEARKAFAVATFGPAVTVINKILDQIPVDLIRETGQHLTNSAYSWAKGDHVTALARGGRFSVPRSPGGVHMMVSEGTSGEQVQVLPYEAAASGDGRTLNFYGDLSFPNITDPDDAEKFIKNLEGLTNG
jgi:TP901 family phage tail tape measure protein